MKKIAALILTLIFPIQCFALNAGVISDIHSGKDKKRKAGSNITYPKKAEGFFKAALKNLKRQGAEIVIVLGDNANKGQVKYYKKLKKAAKKYGLPMVWVKGNHDSRNFAYLRNDTNYFVDIGDVRIIVVDTTYSDGNGNGQVSPEGLALYQSASQTDKKVVLAMHHPPYYKNTCDWNPLYDAISDADTILAGHWHKNAQCGSTRVFTALTERKRANYFMVSL